MSACIHVYATEASRPSRKKAMAHLTECSAAFSSCKAVVLKLWSSGFDAADLEGGYSTS